MDKLSFRKAIPKETLVIAGFQVEMAMETEGITLDLQTVSMGIENVFREPTYGYYLVAEFEGKIIASCLITYEWSDWRNGVVWWIQSVYVVPAYRKKKVFSQMYRNLQLQIAGNKDVKGLRLYVDKRNEIAIMVYKRLGMNDSHYSMFEWIPD